MEERPVCNYFGILQEELLTALGCTEPIAIAYAAATAREYLEETPVKCEIYCSGNIIKNAKSVVVPNSGGMRGIDVAATLGIVGGNPQRKLEVLDEITAGHIQRTKELLQAGFCRFILDVEHTGLYIAAVLYSKEHSARVVVSEHHTFIKEISKDGKIVCRGAGEHADAGPDRSQMTIEGILNFAETVALETVRPLLDRQILLNSAIADEGLNNDYGACVGKTLMREFEPNVRTRAQARAAAGSDARMGGCSLPVVINSGSGNQGVTVSIPVIEYAKEWKVSSETLYRALIVSNLISIHQKYYIGSLSAFCGAVSAACGAGAAITYMAGGTYQEICNTITNTVANVGGILCDGAKSSCAAKIAASVYAAILAHHMSMNGRAFSPGEGIVLENAEQTMKSIGYVGKVGMKKTDEEILNVMTGTVRFSSEMQKGER